MEMPLYNGISFFNRGKFIKMSFQDGLRPAMFDVDDGKLKYIENGVHEVPGSGGSGGALQSITITLTDDDIKALPLTPFELIPAQGAGKAILPTFCCIRRKFVAPYTNAHNNLAYLVMSESIDEYISFTTYIQNRTYTSGLVSARFTEFFEGAEDKFFNFPCFIGNFNTNALGFVPDLSQVSHWDNSPIILIAGATGVDALEGGDPANKLIIDLFYTVKDL